MSRNTEPCDPIVLLKQMSLSPCAFTSSFGMVASASAGSVMWVVKGCRGVFCCAGRFVSCGSKGERGRQHCGCNTTKSCAPVTRAWPAETGVAWPDVPAQRTHGRACYRSQTFDSAMAADSALPPRMWTQRGCGGFFCCGGALVRCTSTARYRQECSCLPSPDAGKTVQQLMYATTFDNLTELRDETTIYQHYVQPPAFDAALRRVSDPVAEGDCIEVLHVFYMYDRRTDAAWLYPLTGTGVYLKIGRVLHFAEHFEFNRRFNRSATAGVPCSLANKCRFVSSGAVHEARAEGWQMVHFTRHTQDLADVRHGTPVPKTELMDLRPALPFAPGTRPSMYFADPGCTRACEVVAHRAAALRCKPEWLPIEPSVQIMD